VLSPKLLDAALDLTTGIDAAIAEVPAARGVFALFGHDAAAEPYISQSADLRRRLHRLLGIEEAGSRRLNLRQRAARVEWSVTGSALESNLCLYRAYPDPRQRLKLRPPPMLRYAAENNYPRVYITTRLSLRATENFYGPFPSRVSAENYLEAVLDLFLLRRCDFNLVPDPAFPGCIYSEMHKCLAPCFKGCTDERYQEEAAAVREFLDTCGKSTLDTIAAQRDAASAALDFEQAAALHAKYEKAKAAAKLAPDLARPLSQLQAVVVEQCSGQSVALFLFRDCRFTGPLHFSVAGMRHANESSGSSSLYAQPLQLMPVPLDEGVPPAPATSLDDRLQSALDELQQHSDASSKITSDFAADQLALLRRWCYRPAAQKTGEIFFPKTLSTPGSSPEWPLKPLLRGISRVFTGQHPPAPQPDSAPESTARPGN
jgi:hypothetical protein